MRSTALIGLAILTVTSSFDVAPANAGYRLSPWCAFYNLPGGPMSCSFSTFEECLKDISGVGGSCGPSPYLADNSASSLRKSPRPLRGRRSRR